LTLKNIVQNGVLLQRYPQRLTRDQTINCRGAIHHALQRRAQGAMNCAPTKTISRQRLCKPLYVAPEMNFFETRIRTREARDTTRLAQKSLDADASNGFHERL
jgi:hypothetical protein